MWIIQTAGKKAEKTKKFLFSTPPRALLSLWKRESQWRSVGGK
jgi:hypothetical protein